MASATRSFALRSSLRRAAAASRQTPRLLVRPAARRGYASLHEGAAKSSDLPWLIASVAFTVPATAYLLYGKRGSSTQDKSDSGHHGGSSTSSGTSEDQAPAVEPSGDDKQASSSESGSGDKSKGEEEEKEGTTQSSEKKDQNQPSQDGGDGGSPRTGQTDATGRDVPPPSADSASASEKKERKEEYKEKARAGETKVLTSSSDAPSKKTLAEHPREDPKGGEGEGARKGGPSE